MINLRLILVSGKTKEFLFSPNDSAADIAKHVYDNWPMDWEEEQVSSPNILRLIYQGRFLHGNVTLGALKLPFGKTTVMHLVARETLPEPNSQVLVETAPNQKGSLDADSVPAEMGMAECDDCRKTVYCEAELELGSQKRQRVMLIPIGEYPGKLLSATTLKLYILHECEVVAFIPVDTNGSSRLPCDSEAFQGQKNDQVVDWSSSVNQMRTWQKIQLSSVDLVSLMKKGLQRIPDEVGLKDQKAWTEAQHAGEHHIKWKTTGIDKD
ncbi:hypothetical protein WISP_113789 [Willisornis vidua]|uniref:Ubiquitin-like domain-containing protein n=1 Tax=Willisornis vidua TaxID=1566151 RepID=A0ABQ9CUQ8_9PASS|nr:hypothetical protein WISP_113789 [Willisornis vidua]